MMSLDRAIEVLDGLSAALEEQEEARLMALAALKMAKAGIIDEPIVAASGIYDQCETHEGCTVEIWSNSITGETSVGWWQNEGGEDRGK